MVSKMSKSNLIICVLVFALIMLMFTGISVSADEAGTETALPGLSIDFLGTGPTPTNAPSAKILQESDVNSEFWIGVSVDNINTVDLIKSGMYTLEIGFDYNSKFIEPYSNGDTTWQAALEEANLKNSVGIHNSDCWDKENYGFIHTITNTEVSTNPTRADLELAKQHQSSEDWKMCFANISFIGINTLDSLRFENETSADKQYLIKIPFKLKKIPTDTDDNYVLRLSRGANTFVIGSTATGEQKYAAWDETLDDKDHNIKQIFKWTQDINLFSEAAATLTNLQVFAANAEEGAEPEEYLMYYTTAVNGDSGFDQNRATQKYYTDAAGVSSVNILMTANAEPTVKFNGAAVSTTVENGKYKAGISNLLAASSDDTEEQQFTKNNIEITVGSETYNIYIRHTSELHIVLNPGNSPYGLIEQMANVTPAPSSTDKPWDPEKIAAAKAQYDIGNTFVKGYIPDNAPYFGKTLPKYSVEAWGDGENMDKDPTAIFIYNGKTFRDPGFKVIDGEGNAVADAKVSCSIKVKRMKGTGTAGAASANLTDPEAEDAKLTQSFMEYDNIESGHLFTDITTSDSNVKKICPGVYKMTYSYPGCETVTRNVVVLFENGDTDFDLVYSGLDLNAITAAVSINNDKINGASSEVNALYKYRVMDTDSDGVLSGLDLNSVVARVSINTPVPLYYPALPAE